MESFDFLLDSATARGAGVVPGAALAVVDKEGNYVYKKVSGFTGVNPDSEPLQFDNTYFLASCTKLVTSLAALQVVERGLIGLDDPLDDHLPELASLPVISSKDGVTFELHARTKSITLRKLLTHSNGTAYDIMSPILALWREYRGQVAAFPTSGVTEEVYAQPFCFEPGEGWLYSPGIDWAGLLIGRLNNTTLGKYILENISKPLGIATFTFHLAQDPQVAEKLMRMSTRQDDGTLADGPHPLMPEPIGEAGGAGLYSNVHDYTRFLADLLKENPVLLKKESADLLFTPQLSEGSNALKGFYENGEQSWQLLAGRYIKGVKANHGLGGLLIEEDIKTDDFFKPKGTLTWLGMPNPAWSINREKGLALLFATQVLPFGDEKAQALMRAFETAVWKNLAT